MPISANHMDEQQRLALDVYQQLGAARLEVTEKVLHDGAVTVVMDGIYRVHEVRLTAADTTAPLDASLLQSYGDGVQRALDEAYAQALKLAGTVARQLNGSAPEA